MAGNLIFLRRRIKSVRNTQKLTKAMKTVSAAKLRRASGELKRSRAYREKVASLLAEAGRWADPALLAGEPLLAAGRQEAVLLVVVAGDKGLCGSFNAHALRAGEARRRELAEAGRRVDLVTVGAKASRHFAKRGLQPLRAYNGVIGRLRQEDAAALAADLQELYRSGAYGGVEFVASEFVSASQQPIARRPLFPIAAAAAAEAAAGAAEAGAAEPPIFEPGAAELVRALLPRHVLATVIHVLLQSVAAEQMARMAAMELATRNASDVIRRLTLQLNKMRQAAITKELLEIITATEALSQ